MRPDIQKVRPELNFQSLALLARTTAHWEECMSVRNLFVRKWSAVFILLIALGNLTFAQNARPTYPKPPEASGSHFPLKKNAQPGDAADARQRWAENQKLLVRGDADRLLQLATQLKQALDNSPAGTVSIGALQKSEDIEKLAKRLRKELHGQ